jgi:hypothetical protein
VHAVAQNELLKEKKGLFMIHFLAHLDLSAPRVVSIRSLTSIALLILKDKFNSKDLLHLYAVQDILLHS